MEEGGVTLSQLRNLGSSENTKVHSSHLSSSKMDGSRQTNHTCSSMAATIHPSIV
jgi:hypothetical protein